MSAGVTAKSQVSNGGESGEVIDHNTVKIWALHLLCFAVPVVALGYGLTGPHAWWASLSFIVPILAAVAADFLSPGERRQPTPALPSWPFDAVLVALVAIQVVNVALAIRIGSLLTFDSQAAIIDSVFELIALSVVVGVTSGYSGFVVGHELIHRREAHMKLLGRLILATNLYEHFATEHVRGHHPRLGTPADPATARFDETYEHFFRRTVPAQLKSAWHLESVRLGDAQMKLWDPRMLQHRVFQGLVVEWGAFFAVAWFVGPIGALCWFLSALTAVRLLEAVNYFEHWGITRAGKGVTTIDSWDTDSWFTLYSLVGLSRHADHHATASRPFQQLRYFEDSPKLPYGYFGMVVTAVAFNDHFREKMTEELKRKQLGPFRPDLVQAQAQATAA
jgi:alkane 1-monooxygenase